MINSRVPILINIDRSYLCTKMISVAVIQDSLVRACFVTAWPRHFQLEGAICCGDSV